MPRPLEFKKEELILSGLMFLWEHGIESANVATLSKHLGISRSSFYNAFGSLDLFLLEVIDLYTTRTPDNQLQDFTKVRSAVALIRRIFQAAVNLRISQDVPKGCFVVSGLSRYGRNSPAVDARYDQLIAGLLDLYRSLLLHAKNTGELPASLEIDAASLTLLNCQIGIQILAPLHPNLKDMKKVIRNSLSFLTSQQP